MLKLKLTVLYFLVSTLVNAQSQYKYTHFSTDDGLPTNTIYAVTEDKNGDLVLGTDNGLSIFDGTNFKNFSVKNGLINPFVVSVCKDKNQTIWLINYRGYLQKFENNKIYTTAINTNQTNSFIATKNHLYTYTCQNRNTNKTYYYQKINTTTNTIINSSDKLAFPTKIAPPVLEQNFEEIKLIDDFLIYKKIKIKIPKEVSLIHKVIFRENDVLVLDEKFLFILDYSGNLVQKINLPKPLSQNVIYKFDFVLDSHNNIWLNIQNQGLYVLRNNNWIAIHQDFGLTEKDHINFLYSDSRGIMWIATNEKGLYCVTNVSIINYRFAKETNFFNGFASSLDQKSMFVSTKFALYKYTKNELTNLKKSDLEIKIGSYDTIPIFYQLTKTPTIWNQNLKMLHVFGKQILYLKKDKSITTDFANGLIYSDYKTQKIFASNVYEKFKNIVLHKNEYYFNNSKKINIRTICNKKIVTKRELKFNIKGFIHDFIFIKDTLWIATDNMVYKAFNEKIIDSVSKVNNTNIENINKIIHKDKFVMLCSNKGLFVLNSDGNKVLNQNNFLPSNEVYNATIFEDEILVATKNGLAVVPIKELFANTSTPKLTLINNGVILKKINISSDTDLFTIEAKIQNFSSLKNQIIQYKIDNTNWIFSPTKLINIQNLSYGNHEVCVRVKDINSGWSSKKISINKQFPIYFRWWFIAIAIGFLIFLIHKINNFQIKKIKEKKEKEDINNNKMVELRQNALSAMMNPHFIFNSLNAIQYFVNSNQKEKSSEHLAKLSRLVRLFLSQSSEPFISIQDEIDRLKLYLELEQIRFQNFTFKFNIDDKIDLRESKIPNMIVQPFIENAILHGVSHLKENDGQIEVNFVLNQNILTIEVIDNGFGIIPKTQIESHISKGIAIIKERLAILQQSNPDKTFSVLQQNAFANTKRPGHKVIITTTI